MADFWQNDVVANKAPAADNFWEKDKAVEAAPKKEEEPEKEATTVSQLVGGFKQVGADYDTFLKSLMSPNEAAKEAAKRQEEIQKETGHVRGLDELSEAYKNDGIIGAVGEVASQAPGAIASSTGQMSTAIAGNVGGAAIGTAIMPGIGTTIGGYLGGALALFPQFYAENLAEQARDQQEKGEPVDVNRGKAALAAAGQAGLEEAGMAYAYGKNLLKSIVGKMPVTAVEKAAAQEALVESAKSTLASVAKGAGKVALEESFVNPAQDILQRAQAGEDLFSKEAIEGYGAAIYGSILQSPLGAVGGLHETRAARKELAAKGLDRNGQPLPTPPADNNAFTEATNYENTGNVAGTSEPGVSVPGEQGGAESGIAGTTAGGMGRTELPAGGVTTREEELDNKLEEVNKKINSARAYIKDISEVDPNDERVDQAKEHLFGLQEEAKSLEQARAEVKSEPVEAEEEPKIAVVGARKPKAPGQIGFDFNAPEQPAPEEMTVPPAKEAGMQLEQQGKLPEMKAPEPIEEPETARMNLVGPAENVMAPITTFFNSIKPATITPEQVSQYHNNVKGFLNDVAEFVGGKSTEEVKRYQEEGQPEPTPVTGPDVSAPLEPGPELDKRMAVLNNFFDSLSLAPKEKEALTSGLVKQLPGMSVTDQTNAFRSLLRLPNINTVRGIKELREKFYDAVSRYDRRRTGQDDSALPYSSRDTMRSTDPLVERRINKAIRDLENIPKDERTSADNAAHTYFRAWPYITAMRSAAFDLAVPFNSRSNGSTYAGQTSETAKEFAKWVEENLPAQEFRRFEATVNEYKREIARADQAIENMNKRQQTGKVGTIYERMLGRAPTGKVPGVFDAGLNKKPGEVVKLDPKDFYQLHPGVVAKIQQGDLKGALTLLAKTPSPQASNKVKFNAKLAQRLLDLNLQTSLLTDNQETMAVRLVKEANGQRRMVLQHFQSYEWGNELIKKYGLDKSPTNEQNIRDIYKGLSEIAVNKPNISIEEFSPILAQFNKALEAFHDAVVTLDSPGIYVDAWNTINLNSKAFGFSEGVFLHELTHAATYYSLDEQNYNDLSQQQKEAVNELKELYAHATEQFDKHMVKGLTDNKYIEVNGRKFIYDEIYYGFNNIHEFVAEAYSNWEFQDYLKAMKYRGTDTGLWSKFVQSVIKLFKLDNVLGYTLAHADAIMRPTPVVNGYVASPAVVPAKIRTVLSGMMPTNPGNLGYVNNLFNGKPEFSMAKDAIKNFLTSVNDTARQYYLGAFTLRQLDEIIGRRIPQVREFINSTERMLDSRNQQLEKTRDIINPWMEWQNKNPKESEKLNALMIDSTLLGEDPDAKNGKTSDKDINDAWNNLSDQAKDIYRKVRDFYKQQYENYVSIILDNKKQSMLGAGFSEADIAAHDRIKKLNITGIKELRARLEKKGLAEPDIRATIAAGIKEALLAKGFTNEEIDAHNQLFAIEDHFARNKVEPYFPIRRFGKFSAQFFKGKQKEFYTFESSFARDKFVRKRLEELGKTFDRQNDLHLGNSIQDLTSSNLQDFEFLKNLKDMIQNTQGADTTELRGNLNDALDQLYYLTLPDKSVRKMFLNRKGTAGMDKDMLRAFAQSAFHMAYQQSRFKFSRELSGHLERARQFAFDKGDIEGKVDKDYVKELSERYKLIMNPPDSGPVAGFLSGASFVWYMTSPASAITNMLGVPAVGFPVISARYGAGGTARAMRDYASKFMKSGLRDADGNLNFFSLSNNENILSKLEREAYDQFVADGLLDVTLPHDIVGLAETPSNLYKARFQKAMNWVSMPFHVTERANREIVAMTSYKLAYEKFMSKGYSEKAAQEKAIETAKDLTYKSMFDYSTLNKPRYFQNPSLKVILQFKQFSQQMTYLLARSAYESIGKQYLPYKDLVAMENEAKNNRTKFDPKMQEMLNDLRSIRESIREDHRQNKPGLPPLTEDELAKATDDFIKETRREARARLAGTLGMTAIFAGATGLPLWWLVSGIMNAMHAVFGDEDDTWDFDNWFKNWCAHTFGGFVGDSISRGIISQTLGANVADRLSLNDLWFRDARKSPDEVTAMQNFVFNALGPTAGLAMSFADASKQWREGNLERAIETASPAFVKNFLKGGRFAVEGRATTLRGNELVGDITGAEAGWQALGFTPERVAQRQKADIEMKAAEQQILNRRQSLLDAFFMGIDNQDADMVDRTMERIGQFNLANPGVAITGRNLSRSVRGRFKQRILAETTGGIPINKKLIGELSSMGDYGDPDE